MSTIFQSRKSLCSFFPFQMPNKHCHRFLYRYIIETAHCQTYSEHFPIATNSYSATKVCIPLTDTEYFPDTRVIWQNTGNIAWIINKMFGDTRRVPSIIYTQIIVTVTTELCGKNGRYGYGILERKFGSVTSISALLLCT